MRRNPATLPLYPSMPRMRAYTRRQVTVASALVNNASVAVSRAERRDERRHQVAQMFATSDAESALDLLELLELAWHDCYGEITPSEDIIDDVLLVSDGEVQGLIRASRLAVTDLRDLRLAADKRRRRSV